MAQLQQMPWLTLFVSSCLILGIMFSIVLLIAKYPVARQMGKLLFSYLLFLIPILLEGYQDWKWSAVAFTSVSFYLYISAFFSQKTRLNHLHLLPAILVIVIFFWMRSMSIWSSVIVTICYLFLISSKLKNESLQRGFIWFQNPGIRLIWLRNFTFLNLVMLALILGTDLPWLHIFGVLAMQSAIIHQIVNESSFFTPIPIANKYQKSTLNPQIKSLILDRIEDVVDDQKFYLRDDASLSVLAVELGVTTHHLSQVLNETLKISFQDLLAKYRIREACKLLRDEEHQDQKIEIIAAEVGYNSKSAFNTAFKRRTGLTPSEFRNAKSVQTYGEERLSDRKEPGSLVRKRSLIHAFNQKLSNVMIRISLRNLRKHKLHSSLNIIGLAVGLSACLIITSYVHYELSFDKHYPESENIYRIALNRIYPEYNKEWAVTAPILAPTITEQLPEVENYSRYTWDDYMFARVGEKMEKQRISSVDSGFFKVFDPEILMGSVSSEFFKKNDGVILTETAVKKYFPDENPIGELFNVQLPDGDQKKLLSVQAVIADPPPNAHFSYEVLATLEIVSFPDWIMQTWGTWAIYSYIRVHPDTEIEELRKKINDISLENQAVGDDNFDSWLTAGNFYDYFLQPVTEIHLTSNIAEEIEANSSKTFVYFFALVGLFILLMAVVNFVNMATARASFRTMEVGIRKAIGAGRSDLITQFLTESTLISIIAMVIAVPLTYMFLPQFNQIVGKAISMDLFFSPLGIVVLMAFPFVLGLLSGFYPALYLSNFGPAAVFQKLVVKRNKESLRHILVIGQLLIAIVLIAGTITVFRQMHYMANKPLGFDKDHLIKIDLLPFSYEKLDVFREEAMKVEGVRNLAIATFPLDKIRSGSVLRVQDKPEGWVNMTHYDVDENFLETLGIQLIAGRDLTPEDAVENEGANLKIILNVSGAKALGWQPHEAIDQPVFYTEDPSKSWIVVGVVEDFNFSSLHRPVYPFIFSHESAPSNITFRSATIRLEPGKTKEALAGLENVWTQFAPDQVFDYDFVDDSMAQYYEAERLTGNLFTLFSGLGIFICCLGLFGLMGFVVEKRAKEVGIRKVMGAHSNQIVLLLSKDYIRLVVISSVLSVPITWWGLDQWLDGFAYRVDNSVWVLMLAGVLVTLISWLTVAFYAYQAAQANPVKSLRTE